MQALLGLERYADALQVSQVGLKLQPHNVIGHILPAQVLEQARCRAAIGSSLVPRLIVSYQQLA